MKTDLHVYPTYTQDEANREYTMEELTQYLSAVPEPVRDAPKLCAYDTRTMQEVGIDVVETRVTPPYGSYLKGLTTPN